MFAICHKLFRMSVFMYLHIKFLYLPTESTRKYGKDGRKFEIVFFMCEMVFITLIDVF